jgi:hypothetical protein
MRKRLTGAVPAALAVLTVAATAACSSSTAVPSQVPGAGSGSTSAAPTTSNTPTPPPGVRAFAFPSDVKVVFQTAIPAAGPQRGAMIGYENYVDSMWYAVYTLGKNKTYQKYASGNALTFAKQIIAEFKAGRYALRGTVVYSAISVPNVFNTTGAVVQSCVDVSGLHMVNPSTGQSAGNILNSKFVHSQEQAAAGAKTNGTWWIVHTEFNPANSGGSAGMCA